MTDTPRTDAEAKFEIECAQSFVTCVPASFARELERELAAAQEETRDLRRLIEHGRDSTATELGLSEQLSAQRNANVKLLERAEKAERELTAAQKDAERYRWLRAAPWMEIERICWDCPQNVSMEEARAIFDVNVDAAMKEEK